MARCNTQANDKATTTNNWGTLGTSVSGRHNLLALYYLANLSNNTYKVLLVSYLFKVKRTLSVRRVVSVVDRT